jgi:hypothetical protein
MNRAKFAHCKNPERSGIMTELMRSKKMILSLMGIAAVVALVLVGRDLETVKWVGGFIAGIVASLNLGQGLADGLSEGRTSAGGGNR